MRYRGSIPWKELKIEALPKNLEPVLDFVNAELEKTGCPEKIRVQIDIAVEEVFVNIAHYAYAPKTGFAIIRAAAQDGELRLVFEDLGKPYNPLERPDPDITGSAEDRPIGGLGIFMVKKIMDTVEYRYEGGVNLLSMKKTVL